LQPGLLEYDPFARGRRLLTVSLALLAQAGFPSGFTVTLDAPKGAYAGDALAAARVAERLAAIGVRVRLNLLPKADRLFEEAGETMVPEVRRR
jgi:peptide/nickel transport system substrate-binding protein